jgi:MFS family permease
MTRWSSLRLPDNPRLVRLLAVLVPQGFVMTTNSVAAPWIMRSFRLDSPGLARLLAAISVSSLIALLLTRLFDSLGRARMLRLCVIAGSISAIGAAVSSAITPFLVFDIAMMASTSVIIAGVPVMIAESVAPSDRAMGQGWGGIALGLGAALCFVLMPILKHWDLSWRWLLLFAGSPILAVPWLVPGGLDEQFWRPDQGAGSYFSALEALLRSTYRRRLLAFMLSSVCSTAAISSSRSWGYFHSVREVGLSPFTASAVFLFAGAAAMAGYPLGAIACDRVGRVPTVASSAGLISLMAIICFWGPPANFRFPSMWLATGFALLGFAANMAGVGGTSAATELFPTSVRATAIGYIALAGAAGAFLGQALIAALTPRLGQVSTVVGIVGLFALGTSASFAFFIEESRGITMEMDPVRNAD